MLRLINLSFVGGFRQDLAGWAVLEFGIPTGFEADLESIAGVVEIKRTETANRKVILYFDEVC